MSFRQIQEIYGGLHTVSQSFRMIQEVFQKLLQNAARVITKRGSLLDDYFITKRGKGYNKTRQVLQNAAILTKRSSTVPY